MPFRTTVDYFSLDVEGNELDILRTIPFEEFDIKVSYFKLMRIAYCLFPFFDTVLHLLSFGN